MSSKAVGIRDAICERLVALGKFAQVKTQTLSPINAAELPSATVLILSETKTVDGDFNAGFPHFQSEITIRISLTIGHNSADRLDGDLEETISLIENLLLKDPSFIKLINNELFEAITQIVTNRQFSQEGTLYLAQSTTDITFFTRCDYEPSAEGEAEPPILELGIKPNLTTIFE